MEGKGGGVMLGTATADGPVNAPVMDDTWLPGTDSSLLPLGKEAEPRRSIPFGYNILMSLVNFYAVWSCR